MSQDPVSFSAVIDPFWALWRKLRISGVAVLRNGRWISLSLMIALSHLRPEPEFFIQPSPDFIGFSTDALLTTLSDLLHNITTTGSISIQTGNEPRQIFLTVAYANSDPAPAAIQLNKQMSAARIFSDHALDPLGQTVESAAHVRLLRGQPDPRPAPGPANANSATPSYFALQYGQQGLQVARRKTRRDQKTTLIAQAHFDRTIASDFGSSGLHFHFYEPLCHRGLAQPFLPLEELRVHKVCVADKTPSRFVRSWLVGRLFSATWLLFACISAAVSCCKSAILHGCVQDGVQITLTI